MILSEVIKEISEGHTPNGSPSLSSLMYRVALLCSGYTTKSRIFVLFHCSIFSTKIIKTLLFNWFWCEMVFFFFIKYLHYLWIQPFLYSRQTLYFGKQASKLIWTSTFIHLLQYFHDRRENAFLSNRIYILEPYEFLLVSIINGVLTTKIFHCVMYESSKRRRRKYVRVL
jgi:hypothetical protein